MTNKIVKVDRVRSAAEATTLRALGVDIIGVDLDPNPRFADDRTVDVKKVKPIRESIPHGRLATVVNLHRDPADVVRLARLAGADLVQPITSAIPPHPVRTALRDAGIGIVYAGIEISHDDDPSWVFSAHDAEKELNAALFQVDVLPEYRESWRFLRDSSPEYQHEFQIEDLDELALSRPVVVSLDFTPINLRQISARLPHIRGIALVLGEESTRTDVRFHSIGDASRVLEVTGSAV